MPLLSTRAQNAARLMDGVLIALVAITAFLLGCQEMFDSDVWWHVRAGQWIWASGRVPSLDPFTFTSADRRWIDLHWLFQLILAGAHRLGGGAGMILLASGLGASVTLVGLTARDRRWPLFVSAACWLPALGAMSARFDPRPELLSLLGAAAYLAVLFRTDRTPAVAWLLPFVQVIWVNSHALFVLGPIILGAFWIDQLACSFGRPSATAGKTGGLPRRRRWLHLGGATLAVLLALLVNPYGWHGAIFPFELFPKITAWGGPYKSYVAEFMDLRTFVQTVGLESAAGDFFFRAECLLLCVLPLSFILPAVWRAARLSPARAALLAASGLAAEAAWIIWLWRHLCAPVPPSLYLGAIALVLALTATMLILRQGQRGCLFRVILSFAFGYLALVAVRNINLFGLVAGFVMAWNLGEWSFELKSLRQQSAPTRRSKALIGLIAQGTLALLAGLWIAGIASGWFFRSTGELRRFGLGESPLAYAHEAARFAGRLGMPDRALALDLRQAGVYLFHNGPARKLFIDGRLEVPSRATFETFVRLSSMLREGRPGWADALRRLGEPLILLDHVEDSGAEATLLSQPGWQCVFYDPVASVFIVDRPAASAREFPPVDFTARHFRDPVWRAVPPGPLGFAEAGGLIRLATELGRRPGVRLRWDLRFTLMLLASDRLRQGLASGVGSQSGPSTTAGLWSLLGHCSWNMLPDLSVPPAGSDEPWDPARGLLMAQATFCYRRSLEIEPNGASTLASLHDSFKARRMADAQRWAIEGLRQLKKARSGSGETSHAPPGDARAPLPTLENEPDLARAVDSLIAKGQPETAIRLFAQGARHGIEPSWPLSDRVAATLLHLGRPIEARNLWERASPPSRAIQLTRIATAALAAFDYEIALHTYHSALDIDSSLPEAWFGLALLHTQQGNAAASLAAAREGIKHGPTPAQKAFLTSIAALVAPYSDDHTASPP
jgi:tetratricopeptide (TPR) repeat protein